MEGVFNAIRLLKVENLNWIYADISINISLHFWNFVYPNYKHDQNFYCFLAGENYLLFNN